MSRFSPHSKPEPFSVSVTRDGDRAFVAPSGEIDLSTSGLVRSRLDELEGDGATILVLDLRNVTFLDSSGLRLMLEQMAKEHLEFGVVAGPEPIQRILRTIGIADSLPYVQPPD